MSSIFCIKYGIFHVSGVFEVILRDKNKQYLEEKYVVIFTTYEEISTKKDLT